MKTLTWRSFSVSWWDRKFTDREAAEPVATWTHLLQVQRCGQCPPPAPPAGQSPVCTEWSKHLTWSLFIVTSANVYKQKHEEQQQQSTESNTLWEPPAHSPQVWQRPRKVGCSSEKNQLLNLKTISPRPQERGATAEEKTKSCRETNQGPTADQASRDRYQGRTWFWFLTTSAATLLVELTQCLECFWPFFSGRNYLFVFI